MNAIEGTVIESVRRTQRVIQTHRELMPPDVPGPKPGAYFTREAREELARRRTEAAEVAVRNFADSEAELGFPVPDGEQRRLVALLVAAGVVGVTAHQRVYGPPVIVREPVAASATTTPPGHDTAEAEATADREDEATEAGDDAPAKKRAPRRK